METTIAIRDRSYKVTFTGDVLLGVGYSTTVFFVVPVKIDDKELKKYPQEMQRAIKTKLLFQYWNGELDKIL